LENIFLFKKGLGVFIFSIYIRMNPNDFTPKHAVKYVCDPCDFKCCKESDYIRHITTRKHIKRINPNDITPKNAELKKYMCNCGKEYKHHSSLCNHKKKCKEEPKKEKDEEEEEPTSNMNLIMGILKQNQTMLEKNTSENNDSSLIIELLKQNQDFKNLMIEQNKYMMEQGKQMMELAKNAGNNNNNITKFNMQIFLNETCKDAMNITEFVNSLVLTFKDLEDLGRYGYTQGITNIFTRGLQATEVSKRPIHCSDIKRLIIYINDTNGWEKDNSSQEKVIQLIRKIAGKNLRQATEWMKINHSMIHGPDSHEQRQYLKMISQWFGGTDEENVKIYNKIIRNIAPQCYIDKYPALN